MLKTTIFFLLFFLFFTITPLFKPSLALENLAPNPSMEEGDSKPKNWNPVYGEACADSLNDPPSTFEWNQTTTHSGAKSLGLNNTVWTNPSTFIPGTWVSNIIPIDLPPREYGIDFWVFPESSNLNLQPIVWVCRYNSNLGYLGGIAYSSNYSPTSETWSQIHVKIDQYRDSNVTNVKIGFSAKCKFVNPCSGSFKFDDVSLYRYGALTAHIFEDTNKNGYQNAEEQNLSNWGISFYKDFDCNKTKETLGGWTDINGNLLFKNAPFGDYSVKENLQIKLNAPPWVKDGKAEGWITTTPICQNISLNSSTAQIINIGNFHGPPPSSFPYFSQKDPAWGNDEFDHAIANGFICYGNTNMASCGCSTTSAAMLLKYYGVNKSPDGLDTNPQTLNNWLKTHNGYDRYNALKWISVADYSVDSNAVYGTQKIRFAGFGAGNDFATLNQDLANNKPPILQEPNHYIVATGTQDSTYSINDPYWESRKTLKSYGGNFLSSRRYEKTSTDLSAIYISAPAPTNIFLTNSTGQRVGKDPQTGTVYTEIPNSFYILEPILTDDDSTNPQVPPEGSGVQVLAILNPLTEPYNVQVWNPSGKNSADFSVYDRNGDISVQYFDQTTPPNSPINFELNYSPEPGAQIDVTKTVQVDYLPFNKKNILPLTKAHLPIALLSSPTFNPKDAIVESIVISREGKPIKNKAFYFKINKDKIKDALFFFNPIQAKVSKDDTKICLQGKTKDGLAFKGCDAIKVLNLRHFWEHSDDMNEVREYLE